MFKEMFKEQIEVYIDSDYKVKYVNIGYHLHFYGFGVKHHGDGYSSDYYPFKGETTIEEIARVIKRDKDGRVKKDDHEKRIVDGINKLLK